MGKTDLAKSVKEIKIYDICPVPILFIPGIKNRKSSVTYENFASMDMLRGEEVETFALLKQFPSNRPYIIILPGSHMKFISTDEQGRITGCFTSMSGELLSAITKNTILADAVGKNFVNKEQYDKEMVLLGYRTAKN